LFIAALVQVKMSSNFNCSYMARISLTYIPFLAHLAFWPCELLPSLFVRPSTFHILIFSSETTGPIASKLWWNGPWVASFQNCVRWSRLPTKMATKLKIEKRGMKFKKNLLLWNYWANLNQTLLKWSLSGSLPKLCPAFQISDQDGHHSQT
jgi:hypothetical protein